MRMRIQNNQTKLSKVSYVLCDSDELLILSCNFVFMCLTSPISSLAISDEWCKSVESNVNIMVEKTREIRIPNCNQAEKDF